MIDLSTRYLGLPLSNPLVASASPLSEHVDGVRRLEDAGVSAVVMYSLFEEEIRQQPLHQQTHLADSPESLPKPVSEPDFFTTGPMEYCRHLAAIKEAVDIPVIGSLNGHTLGGWIQFARLIQEAGADALELNLYYLATDPKATSQQIEGTYLEIVKSVKASLTIPLAVKLSPFFTAFAHMATELDRVGADALVLFNRFYQPDIDLEVLELTPQPALEPTSSRHFPYQPLRDLLRVSEW